MSYWNEPPVYQQVKEIMASNPKMSRKEATMLAARPSLEKRTNPARPRMQGRSEIARRKTQVAKGIIRVN